MSRRKRPEPQEPLRLSPSMGDRLVTARYSKAKAKDMTDQRNHGYKARGGPITRILPNDSPKISS